MRRSILFIAAALVIQGCEETKAPLGAQDTPASAQGEACFATDETPAIVETTTSHSQITPAVYDENGRQVAPARYSTETQHRIIQARTPIRFRTPCPDDLTPRFIETLQRALAARAAYDGPITGSMNTGTRQAIRRYQSAFGLNSAVMSLEGAQRLGLISLTPEQLRAASSGSGNPFTVSVR